MLWAIRWRDFRGARVIHSLTIHIAEAIEVNIFMFVLLWARVVNVEAKRDAWRPRARELMNIYNPRKNSASKSNMYHSMKIIMHSRAIVTRYGWRSV
jgi:hypothetical protein